MRIGIGFEPAREGVMNVGTIVGFVIFALIAYFTLRRAQNAREAGSKSWVAFMLVSVVCGVIAVLQLLVLVA